MKNLIWLGVLAAAVALVVGVGMTGSSPVRAEPTFGAPVLQWQHGGCTSWCETGWYSSPAVADIDGDNQMEVIGATYTVFILNGATGTLEKKVDPPGDRQWPSIVVADLTRNGSMEIITAHGDGYVHVFDAALNMVWSRQPTPDYELRSLAAADLEGDGNLEILVASTRSQNQWFVYQANGDLRPSLWPQHYPDSSTNGYTAGCYNENLAAGDVDGDGRMEVIGPNDTHYLAAFNDDGSQLAANSIYGLNKVWSQVGVHVDHAVDLRGYANCGVEHRPNFADSAPLVVDVNGDGQKEVVVVGNVYNCGTDPYTSLYHMAYILNGDRTRWHAGGYDWTVIPVPEPNAAPLSENWHVIETALPNPVAADLDGNGEMEILFASYDGRVHALWLDKTEHGSWPYSVYNAGEGFYRFASEPVVADLDGNGLAEVLFASWTQKGSGQSGKLHILAYDGSPLYTVPLPAAVGSQNWNGALAAPTLANIDADPNLEVVLNTSASGFVAYEIPNSANARILWGSGRGDSLRNGVQPGSLSASRKWANQTVAAAGELLHYRVILRNSGALMEGVTVNDVLPPGLSYAGNVWSSAGVVGVSGNTITWSGAVAAGTPVEIRYDAQVGESLSGVHLLENVATLQGGGQTWLARFVVAVNGFWVGLANIFR